MLRHLRPVGGGEDGGSPHDISKPQFARRHDSAQGELAEAAALLDELSRFRGAY